MTNDQVLKLVKTIRDEFNALVEATSKFIKAFKEFQDNHLCLSVEEADLLKYFQLKEGVEETKEIKDLKNKIVSFNKKHRKVE